MAPRPMCDVCNDLQCRVLDTDNKSREEDRQVKIDGSADYYELITKIGLPTEKLEKQQR